jgi:ribosomal protein S14
MSNFSGYQLNEKVILPTIKKYAQKKKQLKEAIKKSTSPKERLELVGQLHKLPKKSSITRYRTRCLFSYKTGSVDRKTGLNYFQIRRLTDQGKLPGYMPATW